MIVPYRRRGTSATVYLASGQSGSRPAQVTGPGDVTRSRLTVTMATLQV